MFQRIRNLKPYAYVRFFNEGPTLKACLESIKGIIKKGILATHLPLPGVEVDNSLAIAKDFVAENPGFKLVVYPYPVLPPHDPLYRDLDTIAQQWRLDSYYNFALEELKKLAQANGEYEQAWLVKIDADHIYHEPALRYMFSQVSIDERERDFYYMYKFNLFYFPSQHKAYIEGIENLNDHYFCKLDKMPNLHLFHQVTDDQVRCYEQTPLFYSDNADNVYFLNSLHFRSLKYLLAGEAMNIQATDANELDGQRYDLSALAPELYIFYDFFSEQKMLELGASCAQNGHQRKYLSKYYSREELLSNPLYRQPQGNYDN